MGIIIIGDSKRKPRLLRVDNDSCILTSQNTHKYRNLRKRSHSFVMIDRSRAGLNLKGLLGTLLTQREARPCVQVVGSIHSMMSLRVAEHFDRLKKERVMIKAMHFEGNK